MTRFTLLSAVLLVLPSVVAAQSQHPAADAAAREPLSTTVREAYDGAIRNLTQVAAMAPDVVYGYKPAAEARSLGAQLAHVADVMRLLCSLAAGSKAPTGASVEATWKTKADVTAALENTQHYCDSVYRLMTDARALQVLDVKPSLPRVRLLIDNVSHIRQHYGNVRTYLRLNGITPPPTERLPAPKRPTL